jgi:hypothetical protein
MRNVDVNFINSRGEGYLVIPLKSVFLSYGLFMEYGSNVYTCPYQKEKKMKLFYTYVSNERCNQLNVN